MTCCSLLNKNLFAPPPSSGRVPGGGGAPVPPADQGVPGPAASLRPPAGADRGVPGRRAGGQGTDPGCSSGPQTPKLLIIPLLSSPLPSPPLLSSPLLSSPLLSPPVLSSPLPGSVLAHNAPTLCRWMLSMRERTVSLCTYFFFYISLLSMCSQRIS